VTYFRRYHFGDNCCLHFQGRKHGISREEIKV